MLAVYNTIDNILITTDKPEEKGTWIKDINFTPFPSLTTERLYLRQLNREDEHEFYILKSDAEILEYLEATAKTFEEAQQFMQKLNDGIAQNEWILWGITYKKLNKLIGTICLWNISADYSTAELGYELMPNHQGKGIMQEAVKTVLKYGFEVMKLHLIEAVPDPYNSKSIKLLIKNNFIKEVSGKGSTSSGEKLVNLGIYRLTNPALEGMRK